MNGNFTSQVAGTPAVFAEATKDNGISAISLKAGTLDPLVNILTPGGIGVLGENNTPWGTGVQGVANDSNGVGVSGVSTNGTAISAQSTNGTAMSASTTNGNFGIPQILVDNTFGDFARIRMTAAGAGWDIAAAAQFNIYSTQTNLNVVSLSANGDVTVAGGVHQHSSRALKNNVDELSSEDAIRTVEQLRPVQYSYKHDEDHTRHLGFIAEEVPDLVASRSRKTICAMDLIAVLTAALQRQLSLTNSLMQRVASLEATLPSDSGL
jgi:Chaperone of endosialidase